MDGHPEKFTREELERLVASGLSYRVIARRLGVAPSTVRKWLDRFGLETQRTVRLRMGRAARESRARTVSLICQRHGMTEFVRDTRGVHRCRRCRMEHVAERRRAIKRMLVAEAGGACCLCGYARCLGALQFHHVDPSSKQFALSREGVTRSLARARAEARKCVLLCANCHAEVEAGVTSATLSADRDTAA